MRQYVTLFIVLTLQISVAWPSIVLANTAEATALCNPMFGGETSAILTSFNAQKLDPTEACKAYAFLLERNGSGTRGVTPGCYRSQKDRILKLNPGFAVGLYKSLSEIEKLYGGRNIIQSGYRCDPSGNHSRGCAADIIWASCTAKGGGTGGAWRCSSDSFNAPEQRWIDQNGKNAPYNIHLRLRYAPEGHHVEPISTRGCTTGATVGSASNNPLTSDLGNSLRQALGLQQQPQLPPQPTIPQQSNAAQQSPINAFNTPAISTLLPDSTLLNTTSASSSVADRLEELAFGIATTTTGSTTSVPLIITGTDRGTIQSTQTYTAATNTISGGAIAQQTFVSADLNRVATNNAMQQTPIQQTLSRLKSILLSLLKYLQPFHLTEKIQVNSESSHEHEFEY